jgi:chromosome segregation ATPase
VETAMAVTMDVVHEIFRRLDDLKTDLSAKIEATNEKIEATNEKIDAVNADLSAKINHILVHMDEHNVRISRIEEKAKASEEEEPVPCIPSQGPFFLLHAYYVLWFADAPCRHLKIS